MPRSRSLAAAGWSVAGSAAASARWIVFIRSAASARAVELGRIDRVEAHDSAFLGRALGQLLEDWFRRPGRRVQVTAAARGRSAEHTSELQSRSDLVCRPL